MTDGRHVDRSEVGRGVDMTWMIGRVTMGDPDPASTVLPLVVALLSLSLIVLGVRIAVTRRIPAWVRIARQPANGRSQPLHIGGYLTLLGAGLFLPQVPTLASVPRSVGHALFAVALLLVLGAVGVFLLGRRPSSR